MDGGVTTQDPPVKDPLGILKPPAKQSDPLGLLSPKKKQQSVDFTHGYQPTAQDIQQKKALEDVQRGAEQSASGSNHSQNIPVDPSLQAYWKSLSPQEQTALNSHNQQVQQAHDAESIVATPKAEQEAYAYSQTPIGKVVNTTKYIAQKATKGALQVVKGAAYLAQLGKNAQAGLGFTDTHDFDNAFKKADTATDFLSKGDQARVEDSKVMSNLGGLAEYIPAMAAAEGTGGATLYLQGMGQGKETMDKAEANGAKINPVVKNAFILGTGAVNGFLMGEAGSSIFKSLGTGLKNDVVSEITANAIKEAAGKEITAQGFTDLLKKGAKDWQDKALQAGTNYLKNTQHAIVNLGALNVADFALKKGVDATTDQPVFNETPGNLVEGLGNVIKTGAMFGAAGSIGDITKLTPFSQYKNAVVDNLLHDSSDENVAKTKEFIAQQGQQQGWSPEEIQATNAHVDELAKVTKVLPKGLPPEKANKAVELVIGRNDLQKQLNEVQKQRQALDPAFQEQITPQEQLLTDKIEQANDKLKDLATGSKMTYSKGTGDDEGLFFKTVNGKSEEITQSRYDLEKTERDAAATQNSAPDAKPLPDQPQENAPGGAAVAGNKPDEETTNNQITNPKSDESKNDGSKKGEEAQSGQDAQKGNEEDQKDEKGVLKVKSGEAKTEPGITPNKQIKANQKIASNELSAKYGLKDSDGEILFSQFKDKPAFDPFEKDDEKEVGLDGRTVNSINIEDVPPMLKGAYKNLVKKGYLHEYDGNNYLSEDGKKYIDAVKARLETRKAIKSGTDLFPRDAGLTAEETGKLSKLPLAEHSELNTILKNEHGISIQDLKDEHEERNSGSQKPAKASTDEKAIQQPENDGVGNAGKDPPGESAERGKSPKSKATFKKPDKPILTADEEARRVELRKKFSGTFRTGVPGKELFDKEFYEYAGLIFKEAKGEFKQFAKTLIDEVGEKIREHLQHLWEKSGGKPEDISKIETSEPTGVRNADVEAERGKSIDRTHKTREEIEAEGKRLVDSGDMNPDKFAKDLIDNPRPITAEEQSALRYHKAKLNAKQRALFKDSESNPDNIANNQIEYARNEDLIELNRQATEIAGNETGRALGDRQGALDEDYTRVNILRRAKMANNMEPLDARDEAELIKRTKRIEELENKLADREEEIRKLQDKTTVSKVKLVAESEERNAKREITKASLRKEREGILADLHLIAKKARSSAGANKIPVEMIVPLTKLARNYVLDGAISIAQVADKIYNDLKDHLDGITKDDIIPVVADGFNDYLREQNELRLSRAKKLQKTKLANLKDENYEKKVFKKILVDVDYLNIRAEINREQQRINKKINDIENSKKSWNRKAVDIAVRYGRQAKLASVTVLGKLAATGIVTAGIKPFTEAIGKGWSAILPKISKLSKIEGSVSRSELKQAADLTGSVGSISQAYARAATIGMKDAWQELSQGGSNLTALYKERGANLPSEAKEFFGHLHSAIKAPIKRFAFELSYAKRAAKAIRAGLDPLDPVIDAQNRLGAYKDGDRAIFMGDNELSSIYENAVGKLEKSKSSTARTAAAAFRILLPFVKVPTNIVLEGAKYSFGSVSGIARLSRAMLKGFDNLEPEEADIILEHLKKGSVGGAALLLGFFNPQAFGGFYQPGHKKKPGETGFNKVKVFGVEMPEFLTEHPVFLAAQVGASFRQLLTKFGKHDDAIGAAGLATISGLAYRVPQAEEIKRLVSLTQHITNLNALTKFGAETLKGEVEPAAMQQLAKLIDPKQREPNIKKGKMRYVIQKLESGVPFASKNVDEKGRSVVVDPAMQINK